jgi:hypothetical protein
LIGRTSTLSSGGRNWRQSGRAASAPNTGRELRGTHTRPELNHIVSPSASAHTLSTPGRTTLPRVCGALYSHSATALPRLADHGSSRPVCVPQSWNSGPLHLNFCLTPSYQPASDPLRQGTDLNEVGSRPLVHEWDHDRGGCRDAEQAYRNCEGVCRDLGNG